MKEVKYNILINKSTKQFSSRGFECILAVAIVIGVLGLLMFVPIAGIALSIFTSCFLCIGVKKYLLTIATNNYMPVENIFFAFKISIKAFCLKVATFLISGLWAIVFIIPGIVSLLNYSMASFVMAENENLSSLECMVKSKKLVNGFKSEIFILYLSYIFVTVVFACVFSALGIAVRSFTNAPIFIPIIGMILAFMFVLIIFIIPYFELMFANVYVELKQNLQKQDRKNVVTTMPSNSTSRKTTSRSQTQTKKD